VPALRSVLSEGGVIAEAESSFARISEPVLVVDEANYIEKQFIGIRLIKLLWQPRQLSPYVIPWRDSPRNREDLRTVVWFRGKLLACFKINPSKRPRSYPSRGLPEVLKHTYHSDYILSSSIWTGIRLLFHGPDWYSKQPRPFNRYQEISVAFSGVGCLTSLPRLPAYDKRGNKSSDDQGKCVFGEFPLYVYIIVEIPCVALWVVGWCFPDGGRWGWRRGFRVILHSLGSFILLCDWSAAIWGGPWQLWRALLNGGNPEDCNDSRQFHGPNSVTQKYPQKDLTTLNFCNTLITVNGGDMANLLSNEKQTAIVSALAEGSGIRQIERMTGVHRDTIMRLGVRIGQGCAALLNRKMRDLSCGHLQLDEVWGFVVKKQRHVQPDDDLQLGDVWTFCAIDSDTKLVPSFKIGKRDIETANALTSDLASRLKNRVQLSSDALRAYVEAVELAFGADVDYAQIIKT
jgi:IS1 family transposase